MKYYKHFDLKTAEQVKTLPIRSWLPKMHKTPTGVKFTVASKKFSSKSLSGVICEVSKTIFIHLEIFQRKTILHML